jgi:hypothetical protein
VFSGSVVREQKAQNGEFLVVSGFASIFSYRNPRLLVDLRKRYESDADQRCAKRGVRAGIQEESHTTQQRALGRSDEQFIEEREGFSAGGTEN